MTQSGKPGLITSYLDRLKQDAERMSKSVFELIYFYRGALSYEEAWRMSPVEREKAIDFINKQLERVGKMTHPVF